ncbi:hypothetical protein ASD21_07160 [Caulobacter sp. Root1455]|uniref:hypothetical protein n=1 Tax=Caulobacter sp. Root1455 TaxID=1736465 RepID=UPI0006FEF6D0|nr:hypothetical protein [Caulobacter sp. Root1455]KQY95137.1 hypothetical protein ASD21_07160 [Caulobacter sp. Root1455]
MTLLMVWREGEADRIWIVSDSRLSKDGPTGGIDRMTDRAAKILEADLHLLGRDPDHPPLKSRAIGFAYTGSTLVALEAYAAVLPLWARLTSSGEQTLPSMGDCARHLGVFLKAYAFDLANSGAVGTECILLGRDDEAGVVETWQVKVRRAAAGIELTVDQLKLGNGELLLFGSGKDDAAARLRDLNPEAKPWRREPLDMLREQLSQDEPGTVGGGVQVAFAAPDRFHLSADVTVAEWGKASWGDRWVAIRFRGFDLSEVNQVGHTFASLAGVSG